MGSFDTTTVTVAVAVSLFAATVLPFVATAVAAVVSCGVGFVWFDVAFLSSFRVFQFDETASTKIYAVR